MELPAQNSKHLHARQGFSLQEDRDVLAVHLHTNGFVNRYSVGLDGPTWHRSLYTWLWKIRYPNLRAPEPKFGG